MKEKSNVQLVLCQALIAMLEKKQYTTITIAEITQKAAISRRTFYRYFKNKDDLLQYYFSYVSAEYLADLAKIPNLTLESIIANYFIFWGSRRQELITLKKNNLFYRVVDIYNKVLPKMYDIIYSKDINFHENLQLKAYSLLYISGGMWNILSQWLEDEVPLADMADLVFKVRTMEYQVEK